jgi:hypothetical protein
MQLKEKDPSDQAIQELEAIARQPGLPKDTLAKIEKELKTLKAGHRGGRTRRIILTSTTARSQTGPSSTICALSMAATSRRSII